MPTYDERLVALEQTTATLRTELSQALNKIKQLEQHSIDSNHQQTMLLGIAYGQEQSIKAIQGDVSTLKGDVSILKVDVSTLKGDVSILKVDVSTLKGDVSTLKVDVSTLKGDVSTLKGDVSTLKGDVGVLKQDVQGIKGRLDEHTSLLTQILERLPEKS